jgi:hypothetical protein
VDYYFASLAMAHTFAVNRHQYTIADSLESLMGKYLELNKNNNIMVA